MRRTGIDVLGNVPWGAHFCQFYQTAEDLLDTLVPFFREGLNANEACMWVTSHPVNVDLARSALGAVMPDLEDRIRTGQMEFLDYSQWYTKSGRFDAEEVLNGWGAKLAEARRRGYEGLRLTGNTFWLDQSDWEDFKQYEKKVNDVIGGQRMLALCTYSLEKCGVHEILDVVVNHEFALIKRNGNWEIIQSPRHLKTEEALRDRESKLRLVMDMLPALVSYVDSDFRYRRVNKGYEVWFGMSSEQIEGRHVREIIGEDSWRLVKPHLERALRGEVVTYEERIPYRHGGPRWVRVTCTPDRDASGRVCGFAALVVDIEHAKRAEQTLLHRTEELESARAQAETEKRRLQAVMEALPVGLAITDSHGGSMETNREYEKIWAAPRPAPQSVKEYAAYRAWWVDTGKPLAPEEWASAQAVLNGESVFGQLLEIQRFDGARAFVINSAAPIRGADGTILGSAVAIQDITDLRKTEEALRESQKDLNRAQAVAHTGSWRLDVRSNQLLWSDENHRIFGIPKGTPMSYETFLAAVHPEDRQYVDQAWQASLRGAPYDIEHRIVVGGEVRWVHERAELEFDANGALRGGFGTTQDVTDGKKIQDALRESEHRYRSLFETMTEGFALHEIIRDDSGRPCDFRFLQANPAFERQTGLKAAEIIGRTVREVIPSIEPSWIERYGRVALTGEPDHFESWAGPLGRCYQVSAFRSEPGRFAVVFLDVTARKQAEEEIRNLARFPEENPSPVMRVSRDGALIYANPPARAFLDSIGWNPEESLPEPLRAAVSSVLERGKFMETEISSPQGRIWAIGMSPTSESGQVNLYGRDVTVRRRATNQLRTLNRSLEKRVSDRTAEIRRQAEMLRALASDLSQAELSERKRLSRVLHDHIQQLLVAARMQVEMVKRSSGNDRSLSTLQGIDSILKEAIEACRSLTVELSPPVLHEAGLIGGLNWLAARLKDKHGFTMHLRADNKAEPAAEETRFLLFECIRELLFNAVKHSKVAEAQVTVVRTHDNFARVIVEDKGAGFDPNLLKNRDAHDETFGLFSIQQRLTHIGGEMQINTAPGNGTRITLVAPLGHAADSAPEEGASLREPSKADAPRSATKTRVLLVDDHKIVREGLAGLLQLESDLDVVGEASDASSAVEQADRLRPDVVVMDVNLGDVNGVEATRTIVQRNPGVRVIALSMHGDENIAAAMLEAGAGAYLSKGGPSEELIDAIRATRK